MDVRATLECRSYHASLHSEVLTEKIPTVSRNATFKAWRKPLIFLTLVLGCAKKGLDICTNFKFGP